MIRQRSSGDLRADRRYAYAESLLADGDPAGAAELAAQVLELVPNFTPAWLLIGQAHEQQFALSHSDDDRQAAVTAYLSALESDPEDTLGARVRLAALGFCNPRTAMSSAYVRALYEGYAPRFERHLVEDLGYCGPRLMIEALDDARGGAARFEAALDLGCGTGLMGEALRQRVDRLTGVDLSPSMLSHAHGRAIYDRLIEDDLVAFLDREPDLSVDLVVAADVLIYLGELDALLSGTARVLRRGGYAVMSVQSHQSEGIHLGMDGRFAHADTYLREVAERRGLTVAALTPSEIRHERRLGVPGRIIVLRAA